MPSAHHPDEVGQLRETTDALDVHTVVQPMWIDEQIRDGDFVIVEDRKSADNGEMVIALVGGMDVTLKKFFQENGRVRLQPANPTMQPILLDPDQVQVQGVVVGVMRRY